MFNLVAEIPGNLAYNIVIGLLLLRGHLNVNLFHSLTGITLGAAEVVYSILE
jgi:hypothetical protein